MNRRQRRAAAKQRLLTPEEIERQRWEADRYRHHSFYTAGQLRQILVEDAVKRYPTPLAWFAPAVTAIARAEHKDQEAVFAEIRSDVIGLCGQDMPMAGLR